MNSSRDLYPEADIEPFAAFLHLQNKVGFCKGSVDMGRPRPYNDSLQIRCILGVYLLKKWILFFSTGVFLSAQIPIKEWKAAGKLTMAEAADGFILKSQNDEFGKYFSYVNLSQHSPKKFKVVFRYQTDPSLPANAGFTFSFNFISEKGNLETKNNYWRMAPSTNGFRLIRYDMEAPPGATRMELCFQPQGPISGKFPSSFIRVMDFALSESGISKETAALLAKPLTRSDLPKVWPKDRLRGFNMDRTVAPRAANSQNPGEFISDETFKKLAAWNVNVLRLWIEVDEGSPWHGVKRGETPPPIPESDPMAPYREHLAGLKVALHLAEKYHIQVILTASGIVGRKIDVMYNAGDGGGFEKELQKVWSFVAREFGKHPNLLGYDLLNEPNGKEEARWKNETLPMLIKTVREVDTNTYLVVEPSPWALPWGFENFEAVADPKVAYSLHHYMPHTYTHQGIGGYTGEEYKGKAYPGMLKKFPADPAIYWDKNELDKTLRFAAEFQKVSKAPMFVGEFSAIRWAPGAAQWVKDSIDLFEKYDMDWVYHCYWGWNGWNPTFDAEEPASKDPDGEKMTDRMKVLVDAWAKNKR